MTVSYFQNDNQYETWNLNKKCYSFRRFGCGIEFTFSLSSVLYLSLYLSVEALFHLPSTVFFFCSLLPHVPSFLIFDFECLVCLFARSFVISEILLTGASAKTRRLRHVFNWFNSNNNENNIDKEYWRRNRHTIVARTANIEIKNGLIYGMHFTFWLNCVWLLSQFVGPFDYAKSVYPLDTIQHRGFDFIFHSLFLSVFRGFLLYLRIMYIHHNITVKIKLLTPQQNAQWIPLEFINGCNRFSTDTK